MPSIPEVFVVNRRLAIEDYILAFASASGCITEDSAPNPVLHNVFLSNHFVELSYFLVDEWNACFQFSTDGPGDFEHKDDGLVIFHK
jgi:hypothetical protein